MWAGRIAVAIVILWSAACLTLAVLFFVSMSRVESPERYLAFGLGLVMLYMGGAPLAGLIWPAKPKDPNAPIEVPPLEQVRGRTSYGDGSAKWCAVVFAIGAIFLTVSLGAAPDQPMVLIFAVIALGVLAGAGVMTWRRIQYGGARLQLDAPARRGDPMRGVITTSGFGWTVANRNLDAHVELTGNRSYRTRGQSSSVVVGRATANASITRDDKHMTFRFSTTVPLIDTSEGRYFWNVQLETDDPKYSATFVIDVA